LWFFLIDRTPKSTTPKHKPQGKENAFLLIDHNTKAQHQSTTEAQNHNDYPESFDP
jgi:hypothetical protein